jgi:hypothetical protein
MMTNSVLLLLFEERGRWVVQATQPKKRRRRRKKKPQDLMTENSCSLFLFSCLGHPTISSLSLWGLCKTSAMTHVNSITKLHNPVPQVENKKFLTTTQRNIDGKGA